MLVKTNVVNAYRITSIEDAPAGSVDWSPLGPLSRDVWVGVYIYPAGTPVGDITAWYTSLTLPELMGREPTSFGSYEPAYYTGSGDGSTYPVATEEPWPISWPEGATIVVIVGDFGSCTDGSCPDDGTAYALSSGFGDIPDWITDGTEIPFISSTNVRKVVWDQPQDRRFESGLDRGVLYLPDGSAVPWNGLTSVIEHFNKSSSPVYFDGMKINDLVTLGEFSATMKAITYPDEFIELEGAIPVKRGVFYADQMPKPFGLCYRTLVGNPEQGEEASYKIHIIYNVTALPSDKSYATLGDQPSLTEFEWNITAIPQEVPGFRPTAHLIIETAKIDPWMLEEIEALLYGSSVADARLLPMDDLASYIANWFRLRITDNGDGTWTATADRDGFIFVDCDTQLLTLVGANAVFLDSETYLLSDTSDISEIPQISIIDNGDGTWTASTDQDLLINVHGDGSFIIMNATLVFSDADSYRITDTTADA